MNLSIVEFLVYALICYSGVLGLIISAFRTSSGGVESNTLKIIWLIPCIFCAYILASSGTVITFEEITTFSNSTNYNTTAITITNATDTTKVTILNDVWVTVHLLFFLMLLLFVVLNLITLLTKIRK